MNRNTKKGFTIVELIIVIAVIAVLAAVLIPTFSNLIQKANVAADQTLIKNLNTALAMDTDVSKHETMTQALEATKANGFDVEKIVARATKNRIVWDSVNDCFAYIEEGKTEPTYIPDTKTDAKVEKYQLWTIVNNTTLDATYSSYIAGTSVSGAVEATKGVDVGENTGITAVVYKNETTTTQTVTIRTNGGTLEVIGYVDPSDNTKGDVIKHFGTAVNVSVEKCAMASYHEFGQIEGNITLKEGHISLENASKVNSIVLDTTSVEKVAVTQNTTATIEGTIVALDENVKAAIKNSENIKVTDEVLAETKNVELISGRIATSDFVAKVGSGKHCVLTTDVEVSQVSFNQKQVNIDLNGNKLIIAGVMSFSNKTVAKIVNGNINATVGTILDGAILIQTGSKLELSSVDLQTNGCGLYPDDDCELIVKNCNVKAATYGLGTNASNAQANSPVINISLYDSTFTTETSDYDNTALMVNRPIVAYFENCKFNGGRQAVFVRGGNVTFKDCELTTTGKYGKLNQYYDSSWGIGNEVPVAALTIGNRSTNKAYDYPTTVTLLNTKLTVKNNADQVYTLYAYGETASNYAVSISYDKNCVLGRTNFNDSTGNVLVTAL